MNITMRGVILTAAISLGAWSAASLVNTMKSRIHHSPVYEGDVADVGHVELYDELGKRCATIADESGKELVSGCITKRDGNKSLVMRIPNSVDTKFPGAEGTHYVTRCDPSIFRGNECDGDEFLFDVVSQFGLHEVRRSIRFDGERERVLGAYEDMKTAFAQSPFSLF